MSPADAAWVRDLVRRRSAIVLDETKQYLIDTRLAPLVRGEGMQHVGEFVARARAGDRRLVGLLVDAMTTNETSWFRDTGPFEVLRTSVLPYLVRARAAERRLRFWSAACSSGQEAYSVAMLCSEVVPPDWTVEIVGTDLSPAMVARAQEGRFSQLEVNRGLPASHLVRWFTRDGSHWRVAPQLQRMTRFREGNLAEPFTDLGRFDVVLLRNVLIYFDAATKVDILRRVRGVTRPDGVLLLGAAESALGLDVGWNRETVGTTSVLRLDDAPALSPARPTPRVPSPVPAVPPLPRPARPSSYASPVGVAPVGAAPAAAPPVRPTPTTRPARTPPARPAPLPPSRPAPPARPAQPPQPAPSPLPAPRPSVSRPPAPRPPVPTTHGTSPVPGGR